MTMDLPSFQPSTSLHPTQPTLLPVGRIHPFLAKGSVWREGSILSTADGLFCMSYLKISLSLHIFGSPEYGWKQVDFQAEFDSATQRGSQMRSLSHHAGPTVGKSPGADTDSSGASRWENNTKVAKFCKGGGTERKHAMKIPRLVSAEMNLTQLKSRMLRSAEL